MACKGTCDRQAVGKSPPGWWLKGLKRCGSCSRVFATTDALCPCCHRVLKTHPIDNKVRTPAGKRYRGRH